MLLIHPLILCHLKEPPSPQAFLDKEKHIVVDHVVDDPPPVAESGSTHRLQCVLQFVFTPMQHQHIGHFGGSGIRCVALVGNYVMIAGDFRSGMQSRSWLPVHEHMLRARSMEVTYRRSGKSMSWAVDFIFVDLPFGGYLHSPSAQPSWDTCTKDHIRAAIHFSHSTLANSGWLLVMASLARDNFFG